MIPKDGELICYDRFTDVFPYGLCGVVKSQSAGSGGLIVVKFEEKPASEFFDDYFYAGNGDEVYYPSKLGVSTDSEVGHSLLKGELPEISI